MGISVELSGHPLFFFMKDLFQKYKLYFFLNIILISFYFLVISNVKYDISEATMFFAPDARQYLNTSTEFFDFSAQGDSLTRPFFYPLIILLTQQIFGVISLWFFQFLCWILSINLLFISIRKLSKYRIISWMALMLVTINVSFIVFTLNGLTEILTVFLLSCMIYKLAGGSLENSKGSTFNLGLMALLTVTRPVFFYPFIGYLIYHIYRFLIKDKISLNKLLFLFVAVAPVLFQLTLMKVKYDKFKISDIDTITLNDYLLAQTVREIKPGIEYDASIHEAREIADKKEFIWENKGLILKLFIQNINESLEGYPSLFFIKEYEQVKVGKLMAMVNKIYYWLHFLFFIPIIISVFWLYKKEKGSKGIVIFLYAVFLYSVFTCGITFFQGDRILMGGLTLWIFVYAITTDKFVSIIRAKNPFKKDE